MEKQYREDAVAGGVDVDSPFEGREGPSVDVFNFRHLQLAVSAGALESGQGPASAFEESRAYGTLSKGKGQKKKFLHPHGMGEDWK